MTEATILPVTSPDDMVAVLQRRCTQLLAGIQNGANPTQIKEHIVSMYRVAEILEEAWGKMAEEEQQVEASGNGEEQRH